MPENTTPASPTAYQLRVVVHGSLSPPTPECLKLRFGTV